MLFVLIGVVKPTGQHINGMCQSKKIMYKEFTMFFLLYSLVNVSLAQSVFTADHQIQADVKVYVVQHEIQADLKVYRVNNQIQAGNNNGIWFFTDHPIRADKKIYFVNRELQADLKIVFVNNRIQAGWVNRNKKYLMTRKNL